MEIRQFLAPILCLATVASALVIHEGGHAAATCLTGGSVSGIDLLSAVPHVTVSAGGSAGVEVARAIAGSGLVTGLTLVILMIYGWNFSVITQTLGFFSLAEVTGWVLSALFPDGTKNDAV